MENRRKCFEEYANERGFDPYIADNWYKQSRKDIVNFKVFFFFFSFILIKVDEILKEKKKKKKILGYHLGLIFSVINCFQRE